MALLATDPVDLELDDGNDLVFPLRHTSGLSAVAQGCRIAMQTFKGEWFLDLDLGVPYLENDVVPANEALLGGKYNAARVRSAFLRALQSVPGVISVTSLLVDFDTATRTASVKWKVRTQFGDSEGELGNLEPS